MIDAIDDVVALAWETDEENGQKRLVFRFGMTEQEIKDKLYEKDLILERKKKVFLNVNKIYATTIICTAIVRITYQARRKKRN